MSNWQSNQNNAAAPAPAKPAEDAAPAAEAVAPGRLGKNITLSQFTLYTPSPRNPEKNLRLNVGISGTGYPFMNTDADESFPELTKENNFGKLNARLGGSVFFTLLNILKMAKEQEPNWKIGLQNYHSWVNGKRLDKVQHVNDVMVGVDGEGCVWMTIVENGRESVRFFFGPSDYHSWKKSDGQIASRKEMNHWSVDGYVFGVGMAMSAIMGHHAVAGTGEEKFANGAPGGMRGQSGGGGGGGGWQKGGGGGGWKGNNGGGGGGWKGNGGGGGGGWKGNNGGGGGGWKGNNNGGGGGGWQKNNGGGGGWQKGGGPEVAADDLEL